jgi:hypothetical protein
MRLHTRNSSGADAIVTRIASVSATSTPNVFQATLSTGIDVRRGTHVERLGTWRPFPSRVPLLDSHRRESVEAVVGYVDNIRSEAGNILADVHISESKPQLATLVREGALQEMSIGFSAERWTDGTSNGERIRTGENLLLREASLVVLGADPGARLGRADDASRIRDLAETLRVPSTVAEALVTRGSTFEEARSELVATASRQQPAVRTFHTSGDVGPSEHARAMGEALACRLGARNEPSAMARPYVNDRFPQLCRRLADVSNISTTGLSDASIVKRVMSSSDFPILLGQYLNITLMAGYKGAPSPLMALVRDMSVPDFRDIHLPRLSQSPLLQQIAESGEIAFGSLGESEESFKITRWGRGLSISFQVMVNDRLNAISDQVRAWGYAVAQTEAAQLITLLTANSGLGPTMHDGLTLFHANHGNLLTPAAAPSETSFDQGRVAMRRMKNRFSELLGIEPAFVLTPPEQETLARKQVASVTPTQVSQVNVTNWQVLTDARLSDTKRWYLFASPSEAPVFMRATLSGFEAPSAQSQIDFMTDNVLTKVTHSFGFGIADYPGCSTNAGA